MISDDETGWNTGASYLPAIAVDGSGTVHVVWYDYTDGAWGTDKEIMYCAYTFSSGGPGNSPIPGFELAIILLGMLCITAIYFIRRSRPKEIPTL